MKPLRSVISAWEPGTEAVAGEDPASKIRAQWASIVGADVAAHTRPEQIVRDALLVVTRSSAWSQQLSFLSERILSSLRSRAGVSVERLRFRVGRVTAAAAQAAPKRRPQQRTRRDARRPAESLEAAIERFKDDVSAAQRAKARAGWKPCGRCGIRIAPCAGTLCTPCENAATHERNARVARLLFEAPWLGYAGIAVLAENLTLQDYAAIRLRLLRQWRDVLERARRTRGAHLTTRDRMIASSYVLLKSELEPERIAPAVVRDLLGEELHEIFYGGNPI